MDAARIKDLKRVTLWTELPKVPLLTLSAPFMTPLSAPTVARSPTTAPSTETLRLLRHASLMCSRESCSRKTVFRLCKQTTKTSSSSRTVSCRCWNKTWIRRNRRTLIRTKSRPTLPGSSPTLAPKCLRKTFNSPNCNLRSTALVNSRKSTRKTSKHSSNTSGKANWRKRCTRRRFTSSLLRSSNRTRSVLARRPRSA